MEIMKEKSAVMRDTKREYHYYDIMDYLAKLIDECFEKWVTYHEEKNLDGLAKVDKDMEHLFDLILKYKRKEKYIPSDKKYTIEELDKHLVSLIRKHTTSLTESEWDYDYLQDILGEFVSIVDIQRQ